MIATSQSASAAAESETELRVRGMTCQGCARHVREALQAVPGVEQVAVDLQAESARIRWVAGTPANPDAVVRSVVEAGYGAEPISQSDVESPVKSIFSGWTLNLALGVPVTLLLMLGEWALDLSMVPWFRWLAFALSTIVQFICGARFYRGAWLQFKAGSSNMDTLVALGSSTAYLYSVWALFQGAHVYFMEAAAIITLISAGHWMEGRMSQRAAGSMKKLLSLAPTEARRRTSNGNEETISISTLQPGDVVLLRPGDRVPTDGDVLDGTSSVDEAMLTGESMPVEKSPGSVVYGGTVNLNARLEVRVTAVGRSTALAQIIAAVERAQNSRASIQRLGDRVSAVFVPIVVGIALLTALWWGLAPGHARSVATFLSGYLWPLSLPDTALALAMVHAAAVLIIACPCAMGLATPVAIMAGTNAAADRGILIRDGIALEKAGTITTVVFDKTGTLTHGRPRIVEQWVNHALGVDPVALAAEMARNSSHPLSKAIAGAASASASVQLEGWREIPGFGSEAAANGRPVKLGSLRWVIAGAALPAAVEKWQSQGKSVVGLSLDNQLAAAFALEDTLKNGVADVVRSLKQQGLRVCLLTGDNRRTAEAIAAQAGIDQSDVSAEVRPEGKASFVRTLQVDRGERVAFIGDGINDAPALEQADLGIAVGRASDVARMAADIVLLKSDVHAIPESIAIARSTLRAIKQNLFWAFFYNAAAIPLAVFGFLSPVLCALAMGLSDVVVIGNALRLRRWRGGAVKSG